MRIRDLRNSSGGRPSDLLIVKGIGADTGDARRSGSGTDAAGLDAGFLSGERHHHRKSGGGKIGGCGRDTLQSEGGQFKLLQGNRVGS